MRKFVNKNGKELSVAEIIDLRLKTKGFETLNERETVIIRALEQLLNLEED